MRIENIRQVEGNRYVAEVDGVERSVNIKAGEKDPEAAVRAVLEEVAQPVQPTYADKRRAEYPTWRKALEMIAEQGLDAYRSHIAAIKAKYPKE